jgi:hypothetical protein
MRMFLRVIEMTGATHKHGKGVTMFRKDVDRLNTIPVTI